MYDVLIKNGFIIDGTGESCFRGDIAIAGDKIARIDSQILEEAEVLIEAGGKMVCPGFIDVHTHDDLVFDLDAMNRPKLYQGVTTVITGNCGFGAAPVTEECFQDMVDYNAPILGDQVRNHKFESFGAYLEYMENVDKAINVACLLPHGNVYMSAHGFHNQPLSDRELEREIDYVKEAMDAGALGLSFGLMYAPGCYSENDEIRELAKAVGAKGGIVTIHLKSESNHFQDSIKSASELSTECHVPVEISHLKNVGKEYWGNMKGTIQKLDSLLNEGVDLSFDMYPYTMGSTTMAILFPTEYLTDGVKGLLKCLAVKETRSEISKRLKEDWGEEDNLSLLCGWENVIISSVKTDKNSRWLGKAIKEIAEQQNKAEDEAFMDLFLEEEGEVSVLLNHIAESDLEATILYDGVFVASDGLPGAKSPHPRLYGTFPRFLREFVREKKLLSWEKAINKITLSPAKRFGLRDRGALKEGFYADIVILQSDDMKDTANYHQPQSYPKGIDYVMVNGQTVLSEGNLAGAGQGKLLKYRTI